MSKKMATKQREFDGVKFTFADKAQTTRRYGLTELSADIVQALAVHGLSQKLGDSYAGVGTVLEAIVNADDVWKNLLAGRFNAIRQSGTTLLAEAVARIKGISVEKAQEAVNSLDEDGLDKLKANTRIKAMITVIRGERAAGIAENDSDELDELI